jgi:hypothetical protein
MKDHRNMKIPKITFAYLTRSQYFFLAALVVFGFFLPNHGQWLMFGAAIIRGVTWQRRYIQERREKEWNETFGGMRD